MGTQRGGSNLYLHVQSMFRAKILKIVLLNDKRIYLQSFKLIRERPIVDTKQFMIINQFDT